MLGMPKILLSGDSPSAPMNHEEDDSNHTHDHEVTLQLGEAMEDNVTIELQASYEGGEGCMENTTNPPQRSMCGGEKRSFQGEYSEGHSGGGERSFQGEYSEGHSEVPWYW